LERARAALKNPVDPRDHSSVSDLGERLHGSPSVVINNVMAGDVCLWAVCAGLLFKAS
jgi:hypothetical protein